MATSRALSCVWAVLICFFAVDHAHDGKDQRGEDADDGDDDDEFDQRERRARLRRVIGFFHGYKMLPLPQFMLHSFAQPLFNHALIIQIARPREPLDARQHPGIDPQRDRDRLRRITRVARQCRFHQPQVRPVFRPEVRLTLFAVEEGHFLPVRKGAHASVLRIAG